MVMLVALAAAAAATEAVAATTEAAEAVGVGTTVLRFSLSTAGMVVEAGVTLSAVVVVVVVVGLSTVGSTDNDGGRCGLCSTFVVLILVD